MRVNVNQEPSVSGGFSFDRSFTQGPDPNRATATAGDGMASFLLGVGSGSLTRGFNTATRSPYYAFYAADDWKVTRKLTLNLGLRYGLDVPYTERFNRANIFDPGVASPLAGPARLPGLTGGLRFLGTGGTPPRGFDTDLTAWDPRIGFAYQALKNTVVRGGYGIFHAPSLRGAGRALGTTGFSSVTQFVAAVDGITPSNYLRDPFPGGLLPVPGAVEGLRTGVGAAISAQLLGDNRVPYVQNWSFTIQHQLPGALLVEAGYAGHLGLHLSESSPNLNQLRPEQLQLGTGLQQRLPNPFLGLIATGPLAGSTVPRSNLIAGYPQFQSVAIQFQTGATSSYHSFQLKAEKRFRSGMSFLLSYTAQKLIDDNSATAVVGANAAIQNLYDRRSDRAVSANDVSQFMVFSYVYELPFGKGKRFGANWIRPVGWVMGGWQINGIANAAKGQPIGVVTQNTSGAGGSSLRPNNNGRSARLDGPAGSRLTRFFDTSVFTQPAPFTFGNTGRLLPETRTAGVRNLDFSLFKNFRLRERATMQFRGEAFNLTNTAQFGRPNSNMNVAQFGVISSQANSPRQIQLGLKLLF